MSVEPESDTESGESESDTKSVEPDPETEGDAPNWSNEVSSDELLAKNLENSLVGPGNEDDYKKMDLLKTMKGD